MTTTKTARIVAALGLLTIVVLAVVSFVQSSTISKLETENAAYKDTLQRQQIVEKSLREFAGKLAAERDSIQAEKAKSDKEVLDWQLKYYKLKRSENDCADEISKVLLDNAPDGEQGSLLYSNAKRYTSNRQPTGEASRKRVVVQ